MVFWGFVLWFAGAVAAIMSLLVGAKGITDALSIFGFGGYMARLFDVQFLTAKKIVFLVGLVLVIAGLIVYFIGRAKVARTGETEKSGAAAVKYWRDLKGEYRKITWPTFRTVVKNTAITLIVCALAAIFICVVDFGLSSLIELLLKL
jgi:preprotein translocase subunit SecE